MEKITKADLRQPDLFVESASNSWVFVEKHFKVIITIFLLAVLTSAIYIAKNFLNERSERHATNELYPIETEVLKIKDGFEKSKRGAVDTPEDEATKVTKTEIRFVFSAHLCGYFFFPEISPGGLSCGSVVLKVPPSPSTERKKQDL